MPFDKSTPMRSIGPSLLLAATLLAGCASSASRDQVPALAPAQAEPIDQVPVAAVQPAQPASALDPTRFCYYEGQAYSPGATRDGLVCGAAEDLSVYSATRQVKPLQWLPVQP
jgi:hypothetical protein